MYILEKVRDSTFINYKSDEGYNALHYAVFKGQVDCVEQMINDPYVDIWSLTKDNEDIFHLMAGTGNTEILSIILDKQYRPSASEDKFKRTPAMVAIRNNNNEFLHKILEAGCKLDKQDSSHNSLLHYAAAYGNVEAILMLRQYIPLSRNKHGLYPCEIAILKGHIGSAKLLHDSVLEYNEDPMFLALSNIRGS